MVGRFFYYLLNVFFTIVPLNMLFRIFPSEKRNLVTCILHPYFMQSSFYGCCLFLLPSQVVIRWSLFIHLLHLTCSFFLVAQNHSSLFCSACILMFWCWSKRLLLWSYLWSDFYLQDFISLEFLLHLKAMIFLFHCCVPLKWSSIWSSFLLWSVL